MPYEFDRYVDAQLMAEGCRITHAGSLIEALEKSDSDLHQRRSARRNGAHEICLAH